MKRLLLSCLIGILMLISFANFVSSEALCDKDIDLILTLDNSASIPSSQFNQIKTQSINFLDLFNESNQRIGLVDFTRQGTLIQGLTYDFFQVAVGINSMTQLGGGTNMGEGILKSTEEFQNNGRGVSEYMIVMSDGLPNVMTYSNGTLFDCPGTPNPLSPCVIYALDKAQEAKDDGIVIFTIGSNLDVNSTQETFMKELASDPDKYFASPNFANLEEIYNQIGMEICGDTTAPTITSTIPTNGATDVSLNQNIIVTFSESINPSTVNSNTFVVKIGSVVIPGTISVSGNVATFNPTSVLLPNSVYTVTITNSVEDLAGNNMVNNYIFSFTTENTGNICTKQVDTGIVFNLHPSVPAPIDVPTFNILKTSTKNFIDLFDSNLDLMGLASFDQRGHLNVPLTNNFNVVKTNLDFFSASELAPPQDLGEGITKSHEDFLNLRVTNPSRNSAPDVMVLLSDGLSTFPINHNPNDITFSCIGQTLPTNCTNYALEMAQNAKNDGIKIYVIGLNITPAWNGTGYSTFKEEFLKSISSGQEYYFNSDLSSSNLEQIYNQIQTEICEEGDTTAPTIVFTVPANGATDVSLNQNIIITFSEPMDFSSINSSTFMLTGDSGSVSGTIIVTGSIATFVPFGELEQNTDYIATITNEVKDLSGMNMVNDYIFIFRTGDENSQEEGVCGNEIREANEECDDGNLINDDDCTNLCTFNEDSDDNDNDNNNDDEDGIISLGGGNGECNLQEDCTEWSPCLNGIQTRTCTLNQDCINIFTNNPIESKMCGEFNLQSKDKESSSFWLFFWILFVACVLLLILILVLRMLA